MGIILIGERINGSFKDVGRAIQEKAVDVIRERACKQAKAGAHYLDVNMGAASRDVQDYAWLVKTVAESTHLPLSLDCNKTEHFKVGLETYREVAGDRPVLINSTTAEDSKLGPLLEMAVKYDASVLGVVMDERGSPQDVDRRVELGAKIFGAALEAGIPQDRIILDPIVMPVKFMQDQPKNVLAAIQQLTMLSDPPPHISIGLSNVASKTEERKLINRTFMVMAMAMGLDCAILDVSDADLMASVLTAELLMNKEIYSDGYLKSYQKNIGLAPEA
ncbi:MAG: methyltetrahydrofolate--corrinoid methyltransferase [Acidobacteria bacterium]|nr:MAG: methyltetrahydrofolate--corrinoid methyltransferase [Acidobacteriota bacterium]